VLALLLVIGGVWVVVSLFQPGTGSGAGTVVVRVPPGAGAGEIGDLLARRGVVDSGFFFSVRAALAGKRGNLRSGTYTLKRGMSYGAALDVLTRAPSTAPVFSVVIPEGLSIAEAAPRVRRAGVRGSYVSAAARRPPRRAGAPRGTRTLEGFLFPATYQLRRRASARALVAKQLAAFGQNIAGVGLGAARRRNLTLYDVVIIASMVEREAATQRDRPLIASVIYNRLRAGMPLQIDATTRYARRNWSRPLRVSDFPRSGRYDTRHRLGLPPTPVGNPGLASLRAAAHPARTRFAFYVVKPGTCGHAFVRTQAEFDAAVARYNAAKARNGGRSPTKC
jgi:uncharacterized YceG family protein